MNSLEASSFSGIEFFYGFKYSRLAATCIAPRRPCIYALSATDSHMGMTKEMRNHIEDRRFNRSVRRLWSTLLGLPTDKRVNRISRPDSCWSRRTTIIGSIASAVILTLPSLCNAQQFDRSLLPQNIPSQVSQIVLVLSQSWDSPVGQLIRLERHFGKWHRIGNSIPVNFGSRGLGWGRGLHRPIDDDPQKREGDRRAPAGIFNLGPVFGYAPIPPADTTMTYRQITDRDYFVDDVKSADYNKLMRISDAEPNQPSLRWGSYEVMHRSDDLYELGIVVQQNIAPIISGRGSAVFLHVWRGQARPTTGCTSLSLMNIRLLIKWLNPAMNPVMIQVPISAIKELKFASPS